MGEQANCNEDDCPIEKIDCIWDSWETWSPCTGTVLCGSGNRERNRLKSVEENSSGTCFGSAKQTETCDLECEEVTTEATEEISTEECSGECAHEQPNMEPELSFNEAGEEDGKNKEEGPNIGFIVGAIILGLVAAAIGAAIYIYSRKSKKDTVGETADSGDP